MAAKSSVPGSASIPTWTVTMPSSSVHQEKRRRSATRPASTASDRRQARTVRSTCEAVAWRANSTSSASVPGSATRVRARTLE
jgi:hypothetical protein